MTISKLTDLEFIVLACDGIFDVMNNTEVIKFVRSRLAQRIHPKEVIITNITVFSKSDRKISVIVNLETRLLPWKHVFTW